MKLAHEQAGPIVRRFRRLRQIVELLEDDEARSQVGG
jgi:hypothetical protein